MLTVDEGLSDSYDVVLTSEPTGDVSVEITPPANTDISVESRWRSPSPRRSRSLVTTGTPNSPSWSRPRPTTWTPRTTRGPSPTIVSGGDYDSVISVGSVSVTVDDDEVSVSFERAAYSVAEGGDAVTVTVRLSAPAKGTFVIDLVKTHQDGATEADYSALPDSLDVRTQGDTEQSFGFSALADTEDDDGESVLLGFDHAATGRDRR